MKIRTTNIIKLTLLVFCVSVFYSCTKEDCEHLLEDYRNQEEIDGYHDNENIEDAKVLEG